MNRQVQLIKNFGRVKNVKRSGWVREGIENAESVADHSWRAAMMAMVFGPKLGVDTDKMIKMLLVHDLGEASIGDIVVERGTKVDASSKVAKDKKEIATVKQIFSDTDDNGITALHAEAMAMQTREAKMLKQIERLEMAVQALEYEETTGKDLSEFFENAAMHITDPYLKEILETVVSLRPKNSK